MYLNGWALRGPARLARCECERVCLCVLVCEYLRPDAHANLYTL